MDDAQSTYRRSLKGRSSLCSVGGVVDSVPTRVAATGAVMPGTLNFTPVTAMSSVARTCSLTDIVLLAGYTAFSIGQSHAPFGTVGSFTPAYTTSVLLEIGLPL